MRLLLIVLLLVLIIGGLPGWPHGGFGFGYYPSGFFALLLIILIIYVLSGGRL